MHALQDPMYDPSLVGTFIERLPVFEKLVAGGGSGTRPLALVLATVWAAQHVRQHRLEQVKDRWSRWDGRLGRYLDEGDSLEILPQGIGALVYCDELAGASRMIERVRAASETSGSVMQYL